MICSLQKPCLGNLQVWLVLLERPSRHLIAKRNSQRGTILIKKRLPTRMQVKMQEVHRVFLGPRPACFARDVRSDSRQNIETEPGNERLEQNDRHEW